MNLKGCNTIPLPRLSKGSCGLISEVQNVDELSRLQSMGVCIGRRVEVIKTGDPLIIRVFGSRIGLSARMAEHVMVEPCSRAPRCWEAAE
ncbi:MAG: ferrous iron transport protein A [Verrucomicrobia bacterium]|nr:ferrous iron transport protein A [Verrucomicrobiota bacterium]MCH8526769.1 ferrous iron transport protein A [Kiritimatiellia bacterium]